MQRHSDVPDAPAPIDGNLSSQPEQRRAWLLSVLQHRPDILARLAYYREWLRRLPRQQRRWLARRVALPLSALALMLAISGMPGGLSADSEATITVANGAVAVNNDGICSLIEAINNANATSGQPHADCAPGSVSGADTIILPPGSSFALTNPVGSSYYGDSGLPDITSAIVISGSGATIARSGQNDFRLFNVVESGDLTLNNVTLSGGNAGYYYGGAVRVMNGSVTVNSSTLSGNGAEIGAAIYAYRGEITINDSTITGGTAYAGSAIFSLYTDITIDNSSLTNNDGEGGGALAATYGQIVITDAVISDNSTKYGYGGGLYLQGVEATITDTTISNNTAVRYSGGGLTIFDGAATITGSTITNNTAGLNAGGIYGFAADIVINETTISDNTAKKAGGGVVFYVGDNLIVNSTISGNEAELGGGVRNFGETVIANSTLSQNQADSGGGIANIGKLSVISSTITGNAATGNGGGIVNSQPPDSDYGVPTSADLILSQALISGNSAGGQGAQVHSSGEDVTVTADDFNLLGASGAAGVVGFTPGATDIVPAVAVAAILQTSLGNNGGPTQTHALVANSPAIDAGDTEGCAAPPVNNRDQRGQFRPRNNDGKPTGKECDIGAVEAPGQNVDANFEVFMPISLDK